MYNMVWSKQSKLRPLGLTNTSICSTQHGLSQLQDQWTPWWRAGRWWEGITFLGQVLCRGPEDSRGHQFESNRNNMIPCTIMLHNPLLLSFLLLLSSYILYVIIYIHILAYNTAMIHKRMVHVAFGCILLNRCHGYLTHHLTMEYNGYSALVAWFDWTTPRVEDIWNEHAEPCLKDLEWNRAVDPLVQRSFVRYPPLGMIIPYDFHIGMETPRQGYGPVLERKKGCGRKGSQDTVKALCWKITGKHHAVKALSVKLGKL